jgi:outer membrane protein OmpA-like peptidoglycan-associated protein
MEDDRIRSDGSTEAPVRAALLMILAIVLSGCAGKMQDAPDSYPPATAQWIELAPVTVFFDHGDANLDPGAQALVADAIARVKKARTHFRVHVKLTGHTDSAEARSEDPNLSLRRAEAVRTELMRARIPAIDIDIAGRGANEPAVVTEPGAREPGNRRVDVEFDAR